MGNPHGTGKGTTPSGQIRLVKADTYTQNFSTFFFNVTGVTLLSDAGDHQVMFDTPKKINWSEQNSALLEETVPERTYRGLRLSFDRSQPATGTAKDGVALKIANINGLSSIQFKQTFSVSSNATKNVLLYLNLDQSLKKKSDNSDPSQGYEVYEFAPFGGLLRPEVVRSIQGKYLNRYAQGAKICLYRIKQGNQASLPDLDQAGSSGYGPSTVTPTDVTKTGSTLNHAGSAHPENPFKRGISSFSSLFLQNGLPQSNVNGTDPGTSTASNSGAQVTPDIDILPWPTIDKPTNPKEDSDCSKAMIVQNVIGEGYRFDNLWPGEYQIFVREQNGASATSFILGDKNLDHVDL